MTINVTCGSCFSTYRVSESKLGRRFRCKSCNEPVLVEPDEMDDSESLAAAEAPRSQKRKSSPVSRKRKGNSGKAKLTIFGKWGKRYNENLSDDPSWKLALIALVGFALTIAFPFILFVMVSRIQSAMHSTDWPAAQATITRTEVKESRGRRGRISYDPKVNYDFECNGQLHSGTRIAFYSLNSGSKSEIQEILNKYAVGTTHEIRYDPADPSNSVIEPGIYFTTWLNLILPLVFLAGPWLAFMYGSAIWYRWTH